MSAKRYVYVWADGIYLKLGSTTEAVHSDADWSDPEGSPMARQDRRDLLLDLKRRGLNARLELVVANGALGFWRAAGEIWPTARCAAGHNCKCDRRAAEEPTATA
jgi:transposase-like protein